MASFLTTLALLEARPEIDDRALVTPQTTEIAMHGLPWKVAQKSYCKLVGSMGWLLLTSLRALNCEIVTLWSKMRKLESEAGTLKDAKVIVQEIITAQVN